MVMRFLRACMVACDRSINSEIHEYGSEKELRLQEKCISWSLIWK